MEQFQRIRALRKQLNRTPELSGQEFQTKQLLISFLKEYTSLELHTCGDGFYAAHREAHTTKPSIAIRADFDAVATANGTAAHLCGHDGHAAALCGLALLLENATFERNIFLLFQPAEETGAGAKTCLALFEQEVVDEIYGQHNLPGFPFGEVITCKGTFACGSLGLTLKFKGKPTHAAYPEHGISPANAIGNLLCHITKINEQHCYKGMTLCTVVGTKMGEKAFGTAAENAELWLTLRAEYNQDLDTLYHGILDFSNLLAKKEHLDFDYETQDVFPATENNADCAYKVLSANQGTILKTPMRWSEDFGHYLKQCKGAFFGIGAGTEYAPLHTSCYEYPDELLEPTINAFYRLL